MTVTQALRAPLALLSPIENALCERFVAHGSAASHAVRQQALARFASHGLPTHRDEAWHYSDLKRTFKELAPQASAQMQQPASHHISIVNGELAGVGVLPEGVRCRSLKDVLAEGSASDLAALYPALGQDDFILSLNHALALEGVVLDIAPHSTIAVPLVISHSSTYDHFSAFPLCLVRVGDNAQVTFIERYGFTHAQVQNISALQFDLASRAQVQHFCDISAASELLVASLLVHLADEAQFSSFGLITSGDFVRRQIFAQLQSHAQIDLRGLSQLRGSSKADTTLVVHHRAPHATSRELFKHILDGHASAVYQGKVVVQPQAQKTDGGMKSHALLLSDDAAMYNKPELEIYADDVVCGHGATVAQINEDQLFYLMSRGIPKAQAQAMLITAFAEDMLADVKDETIRAVFEAKIEHWMAERAA